MLFTGPRHLSLYPTPATSPYFLPWPAGISHLCIQGNRGIVSHRGWEEFAYDFAAPVGSDICAARGGTVFRLDVTHTRRGPKAPNNYIAINHGDGTTGWYLHLQEGGSLVSLGEEVRRGQAIAVSGNIGRSLLPHIHFHVTGPDCKTIPVTFADVATDAGIPRMFKRYTSANRL